MMKNILLALLILTSFNSFAGKPKKKPNVLFITVDDLNIHLPAYGYTGVKAPNIQKLMDNGMLFKQAYCQFPVCGPSRASLLNSMYPEQTKVLSNGPHITDTRPDATSIGKVFKDAGYWTATSGKIYHHADFKWDDKKKKVSSNENMLVRYIRGQFEKEYGPIDTPEKKKAFNLIKNQYSDDRQGKRALPLAMEGDTPLPDEDNVFAVKKWLDNKSYGDKPFFIALGFQKPHVQYAAPKKYFDMYPLEDIHPEKVPFDDWNNKPKVALWQRHRAFEDVYFGVSSMEARKRYMQGYYACITYIDDLLGDVIESLKKNGEWENTVIVYVSDHGYHMGNHFMYGKVTLFEEVAKAPLIIRIPDHKNIGKVTTKPVEFIDIYPTLTELCAIKTPSTVEGKSLLPLMKSPEKDIHGKPALTISKRGKVIGRSIRTERYRYTQWGNDETLSELYDYEKDPKEHYNVVNDPTYAEVLKDMRREFAKKVKQADCQL